MRARTVDLMLLGTVLLWALNATVTRYVLTHGFHPLAYATIRYAVATGLFWIFTWSRERSFRIAPRDLRYVAIAATMIFANQLCFGPPQGQRVTFVHPDDWLGPQRPWEPAEALSEVARRYARAYGPVSGRQFREWFTSRSFTPAAASISMLCGKMP